MKEVTVFSVGDSAKMETFSNVAFFLTETLLSKGIKVNRVDLSSSSLLDRIYYPIYFFLMKIYKNSTYDYFRSFINFKHVKYRIKKAIMQYPNSEANIFVTFSFSSVGLSAKPSILFCDFTYDYYFKYFLNREPNFFERQSVNREDIQIEGSDLVFTLFPSVQEYMKKRYKNTNIHYLGYVINSLFEVSEIDILNYRKNSNSILFVGNMKYISGARSLIKAFELLKPELPQISLHIVGINAGEFDNLPLDVHCYGYLDKANDTDRELYYKLFREAKLFVNTTPQRGGFMATIEALFFYIPLITLPHEHFLAVFGNNIDFGYYCELNSPNLIKENMLKIFNNNSYESLCLNAHNSVKEFTWNSYIDKMIIEIEEKFINH